MVDAEFKMEHNRNMHDVANRLRDLQNTTNRELEGAAEEIGLRILADAARMVNIDTGRLRASLDTDVEDIGEWAVKVVVGSNVGYADIHEMDYPFLRPAVEQNEEQIRQLVEEALETAAEEASA